MMWGAATLHTEVNAKQREMKSIPSTYTKTSAHKSQFLCPLHPSLLPILGYLFSPRNAMNLSNRKEPGWSTTLVVRCLNERNNDNNKKNTRCQLTGTLLDHFLFLID